MNKKSRNSLTDLLSEINLQELESEPTPKPKPERQVKQAIPGRYSPLYAFALTQRLNLDSPFFR